MSDSIRVAIDVGGTFTDVVKLVPATGELRFEKVATTPSAPAEGVLAAFSKAEAPYADIAMFNHGTTLGLNALLTRTGARIAIVSTHGFRDVYLLGRTDRRAMYDIRYRKPRALVERADTFEVRERSYFDGSVAAPLDEDDARRVAQRIADRGYDAVAVAFLHAYANPAHEQRMRDILNEVAPGVDVTLSHELSREYREYERTSTAVLDAYIKPIVRSYLETLEGSLARSGFAGRFLMSRSGGGAMTVTAAREQPVNLILSGPAGGVIGAAAFSRLIGRPNLITIDMGGTSLDASLVLDHQPLRYQGAEFEGLPITAPSLNIQTIGAGGGSLAYVDAGGALQVGPQSAGAQPGPASYGRGGTEPTFTDAALAVGYLGSDTPLGGSLVLDESKALRALTGVAGPLGLTERAVARGVLRISTTKITGAVRGITVELGLDPKEFALLSFGGGGGLVAVDVARELGVPTVIVPPGQGAFSALGMLMADVQHDFARTSILPLETLRHAELEEIFGDMEADAAKVLDDEGFAAEARQLIRSFDVRYRGQEHSVSVSYPGDVEDLAAGLLTEFEELHRRQYGHTMTDPVEITTLRLRAVGLVEKPDFPTVPRRAAGEGPTRLGDRSVHVDDRTTEVYGLYAREQLRAGDRIEGPAVITEHTATTVLHAGDVLTVGGFGELIIDLAADAPAAGRTESQENHA
ncbi:hydantoinase/oxoprolinase family protein [Streptomyces sp. NPDC047000]|uniref:hydantoinase/oxoprolinase family protein n=1 Tax=Streptomyces sp. NPDC047000 TaxID=3155474 RepID=UPI0033F41431